MRLPSQFNDVNRSNFTIEFLKITWSEIVKAKTNFLISKLRGVQLGTEATIEHKLAILDYFYPKLNRADRMDFDNLMDINQMMVLPVNTFMVEALKKFMQDIFACINDLNRKANQQEDPTP